MVIMKIKLLTLYSTTLDLPGHFVNDAGTYNILTGS